MTGQDNSPATVACQNTTGRLRGVLEAGHFAVTAEITPPASTDPKTLLAKALPLRGLADAVNVTDGASARAHMSSLAAAGLLVRSGIEPILQLTCRDRNRIALQSDILGGAALGVRNFLILRGDDPSAGDQPDAKPVFDLDSRALLQTAAGIRDRGELPSGRGVEGPTPFFLGVADSPIDPPAGWAPDGLRAKIASGAQFAQTQFCMDTGVVRRYVSRLAEHGIADRLHLLIGIAPLASARSARWMREKLYGTIIADAIVARMERAADPKAEGVRICIEMLREIAEIPGIAGAHIMAPLNEAAVPEVIAESGLLARRTINPRR
ncbi:MAG: methylenetetrahydrofolate reductase [Proteobacteria bacterium]|nr:methylenetetrahydrofolate reductase [Pseudomonadota bacterium]